MRKKKNNDYFCCSSEEDSTTFNSESLNISDNDYSSFDVSLDASDIKDDFLCEELGGLDFPGKIAIVNINYNIADFGFNVKASNITSFTNMLNNFITTLYPETCNVFKSAYRLSLSGTFIHNNDEYFIEFQTPKSDYYMNEDVYLNSIIDNPNFKITLKDKITLYKNYVSNYTARRKEKGGWGSDIAFVLYKYETDDMYTLLYYKDSDELIYRYIPSHSSTRAHIDFNLPFEKTGFKNMKFLNISESDKVNYVNKFVSVYSKLLYQKIGKIKKMIRTNEVRREFIEFCSQETVRDKFNSI